MSGVIPTYIGQRVKLYWSTLRPLLVATRTYSGSLTDHYCFVPLTNSGLHLEGIVVRTSPLYSPTSMGLMKYLRHPSILTKKFIDTFAS